MEINAIVILAGLAMVVGIILFITWYNYNHKKSTSTPVIKPLTKSTGHKSNAPGILPNTPGIVTEEFDASADDCCVDDKCECVEEAEANAPVMIRINSISRIKTKSRTFLMDSEANYTKKGADAILNDLSKAFPAAGLDLSKAPFKYTVA